MSYVQEVLQPGEELKYQGAIHWVTYLHGIAWLLAALIVWMVVPASWGERFVVRAVIIVLAATGVFWLARGAFQAWITEIAVTNRRVIYKRGWFRERLQRCTWIRSKASRLISRSSGAFSITAR